MSGGGDRFGARRAQRIEDLQWMADGGENLSGAARRLGISRRGLELFLERHDRALFRRLLDREPRDWNAVTNFVPGRSRKGAAA